MNLIFIIDDPKDLGLHLPVCKIRGWCGAPAPGDLDSLRFQIGHLPVLFRSEQRPDAEGAFPGLNIRGFVISFDLSYYLREIEHGELIVGAYVRDAEPAVQRLRVEEKAL